ncbi:MAG: ParA family protein [Candidatus Tectomicrobia bacterium]|nr:ParA family protein [Candidatus Tectomicrobia bacterium]
MGKIIIIANEKGGTGKTTLAVNLSAALAIRGMKTLLIDMDPQGNTSYILSRITEDNPAMYSILVEKDTPLDAIIQPTATENLDIAPSNLHLAGAEVQLATMLGRENALKRKLTPEIVNRYAFLLIDTSPSLGLLTINALNAADYALIPVSCEFLSLVGLSLLFDTIQLCQQQLRSHVQILGLVATRYDRREKMSDEVLSALKAQFNTQLFETIIRVNVRLKEAPSYRQSIYQYDPVCAGAKDHLALANELIRKAG